MGWFDNFVERRFGIPPVVGAPDADFIVANNTQWEALMARPDSELSGKTAEITGPLTEIVLRDGIAPALPFTIRSSGAGSINMIELFDNTNIIFSCAFQMTGWKKDHGALVNFRTGTSTNLTFDGCTFRHGYGPSLTNFDVTTLYPEMVRPTDYQTATTSSTAYPLPWQDAAATNGRVYIFNEGSSEAYIALGGPGVTASNADELIEVSSGYSLLQADPTVHTHYALITDSGTTEVLTRPEIGMIYYLCDGFSSYGSSYISGGLTIQNCTFTDLSNACKGLPPNSSGSTVIWKNVFHRIYQDIIALGLKGETGTYIVDNLWTVPFSRSGIAEGLLGHAYDPHGDLIQYFSDGTGTISNIYILGNRTLVENLQTGSYAQGAFISDNDASPFSYVRVISVGNYYIGGAPNGISCGESSASGDYPVKHLISYGDTIVNWESPTGDTKIRTYSEEPGDVVIIDSFHNGVIVDGDGAEPMRQGDVRMDDVADPFAVFPNWADRQTATTREEVTAAWTAAAEGLGKGFASVAHLFNFNASTAQAVFDFSSAHPGIVWADLANQPANTVTPIGARRVLLGGSGQTVTPDAGVEVQITSDGSTVVTDWTSAATTVDEDQWINLRATTSGDSLGSVAIKAMVNGYHVGATAETEVSLTDPFVLAATTSFGDVANAPSNITVVEYQFKGKLVSDTSGYDAPFAQLSAINLQIDADATGSTYRVVVEDSAGAQMIDAVNSNTAFVTLQDLIPTGTTADITLIVDYVNEEATLTINGVSETMSFDNTPATTFAQNNRAFLFNGTTTTTNQLPADTEVEYFRVYTTIGGMRTLHKEISVSEQGDIAGINSDPWHTGDDVT